MNAPYTITFDLADTCGCPWLVVDAIGELVAGCETENEAEGFQAELNDEAAEEAEALAWEAGRADEHAEDNRIADLVYDDPDADID